MAKFLTQCLLSLAVGMAFMIPAGAQSPQQKALEAQAKISKDQASKTALEKVPNGTIKEAELKKKGLFFSPHPTFGRLIWSFDIATPDTNDITEVEVDAKTGAVISVHKESAAAEAAEKRAEATKAKKKH